MYLRPVQSVIGAALRISCYICMLNEISELDLTSISTGSEVFANVFIASRIGL